MFVSSPRHHNPTERPILRLVLCRSACRLSVASVGGGIDELAECVVDAGARRRSNGGTAAAVSATGDNSGFRKRRRRRLERLLAQAAVSTPYPPLRSDRYF